MKEFKQDLLQVKIFENRDLMGKCAAEDAAKVIRAMQAEKEELNIIFAAAPSQNDTLFHLCQQEGIAWEKINAFHMDEYIGLPQDAPQCFARYLDEHIFQLKPFKSINYINAATEDIQMECARYTQLLQEHKPDIVFMGIGENGHIAFNDPGVADFQDSALVKIAQLDDICRNQQVNDGCFAEISLVPKYALTLTVPALFGADYLYCSVPCATKAWAVNEMLNGTIDEHCPASILRRHKNAILYCDADSAGDLKL